MKITALNPSIASPHAPELIALFEDLGFKRAHTKTNIDGKDVTNVDLKYGEDFRVNVAQTDEFDRDTTIIRVNVRDFDEAYDYFISKGFKNAQGDKIIHTDSSKAAYLVSPTGFGIGLTYHIRKEDKDQ